MRIGAVAGFSIAVVQTVLACGVSLMALSGVLLAAVLAAAAAIDIETRTIPNALCAAAAVAWLPTLFGAVDLLGALGVGVVGACAVGGVLLVFSLAFEAVAHKPSLGGGDVKLMAACSLHLGFFGGMAALALACLIGAAYGTLLARRHSESDRTMPFAPAIACAVVLTYCVRPVLLL